MLYICIESEIIILILQGVPVLYICIESEIIISVIGLKINT